MRFQILNPTCAIALKIQPMGIKISAIGFLQVFFGLVFPSACLAQVYANPPAQLSPGFNNGMSSFAPSTGIQCPTPTLNVTGFGGNTSAWGDQHYAPYQSASGAFGNYGGAIGISIPISTTSTDFCKRYAKSKAVEQEQYEKSQIMNRQIVLLQNCGILRNKLGVNLSKIAELPEFSANGALSSLAECQSLATLLEPENLNPDIKLNSIEKLKPSQIKEKKEYTEVFVINPPNP